MIVRRINSMVSSLPLKWMDVTPFPLFFSSPSSYALVARNFGCPLSEKLSIMSSAILTHSPSSLLTWIPYHFLSDPGSRNDQCPRMNLRAYSVTLWAFAIQFCRFPRFLRSISLYIDIKMILPLTCSDSHFNSEIIVFWISSRIHNAVNPGKFSTRIPCVLHQFDPILGDNVFPNAI